MLTRSTIAHYGKFTIIYGLAIVLLICCLAFLQQLNLTTLDKTYYMAFALALALGIIHVKVLQTRFSPAIHVEFKYGLVLTILFLVISTALSAVIYAYLQLNFNFLTFILAFMIPHLTYLGYINYLLIPESEFKLSYYPFDYEFPNIAAIDFSETVVVNFVLGKESDRDHQTSFETRAPLNMAVSELFFTFVYEYNKNHPSSTIRFIDQNNETQSWLFYTRKGLLQQQHFLDPDVSFRNNAVSPGQVIYAFRK